MRARFGEFVLNGEAPVPSRVGGHDIALAPGAGGCALVFRTGFGPGRTVTG